MTIQDTQLKWRASVAVSDASGNGGRISTAGSAIAANVKNNVWADVPSAERAAGSTKYRKLFLHVASENRTALLDTRFFLQYPTPGGSSAVIFAGTQDNTQDQLTGSERKYGAGTLVNNITAGATSLVVLVESAVQSLNIFQNGDLIRISDMADVNSQSGNQEWIRLASSNAVSWNGNQATLTLATATAFAYSAAGSATKVGSCLEAGNIASSASGYSYVGAGSFNSATYPVLVDHRSGIRQTWTITFTSATAFTLAGDTLGSMGGGTISSNLEPVNATVGYGDGLPYFSLDKTGWANTVSGDVLTFTTTPAATAIWERRYIPANTPVFSAEDINVGFMGESP